MQKVSDGLRLSASDLVGHLYCRHLTHLDTQVVDGSLKAPKVWDPLLALLAERGAIHERDYVEHLREAGYSVVEIDGEGPLESAAERTLTAMQEGVEIIAQGAFIHGGWSGRTDILRKVERQSALGHWSYEVIDTKLARETKGATVLQLCLYSDLVAAAQGVSPEVMHVVTPWSGFAPQTYRTAAYAAYYRRVKHALEQSLASDAANVTYPDPKEHCEICRWRTHCDARRRTDDHLCLVAGITQIQIAELQRRNVGTLEKLAHQPLPLSWRPERGAAAAYARAGEQARVQLEGRETQQPIHHLIPPAPNVGLSLLPAPSIGDVFLDLEADPFAGEAGHEYLFGQVCINEKGEDTYTGEWALTREEEKRAFEGFVDFVMARWEQYADLHVYHYAPYEPSALKRLMGRYATREDEIDRMLRADLFVDLRTVVKQSLRASVEAYSLKNLEVFYGYTRAADLADARQALAAVQASLEFGDLDGINGQIKEVVTTYNRDDCVSVRRLRDWLETIRARLVQEGTFIDRPAGESAEPSEALSQRQQQVAALVARLTADVPADPTARTREQQARWILAQTLDFHRRENKSGWWELFRLSDLPAEDLLEERAGLAGLEFVGALGGTAKAPVHRYRFIPQDTDIRGDETIHVPGGAKLGSAESISLQDLTIDIKKRKDTVAVHPSAVFAHKMVTTNELEDALLRIGAHVTEHGITGEGPYQAARDLLMRESPRLNGHPIRLAGETSSDAALRIASHLAPGVLPIQGPPGAGKTSTGARMICALVRQEAKVGVTANGHKVIRNLLDRIVEEAESTGTDLQCIQKVPERQDNVHCIRFTEKNDDVIAAVRASSCQVIGGTAWLWSRQDTHELVDVLFVDEAAQMSLANVLAVSQGCKALVLLGDPRQLEQPIKGSHPDGTDVSALDHILQDQPTMTDDHGLFLDETWRLHPDICAFTSEQFYEGRLHARPGLEIQQIRSTGRIQGTGLRFLPVTHQGNQSSSPEEADQVRDLVNEILSTDTTWIDREGKKHAITLNDILIIAPYNAQVFELRARLPEARVGTVDKFQGQEAPIVIYSMTTSTHADAPRGIEFLYSPNRLNVATSRARCICVLVGSPAVFEAECRTPRQMQMANAFCRYLELAALV